jgi:hypothetical protein
MLFEFSWNSDYLLRFIKKGGIPLRVVRVMCKIKIEQILTKKKTRPAWPSTRCGSAGNRRPQQLPIGYCYKPILSPIRPDRSNTAKKPDSCTWNNITRGRTHNANNSLTCTDSGRAARIRQRRRAGGGSWLDPGEEASGISHRAGARREDGDGGSCQRLFLEKYSIFMFLVTFNHSSHLKIKI